MFLVELVMQGVRGIRELARLRFQSGFNFVAAGNESGKTSSVDAMLRLLFPSDQTRLMNALVSRSTPDASRAALVAYSDDGAYYRVIQDFSKGAVNLSKYNTATKDFALLYKDWQNTVQFMAGLTGGMTEDEYTRLFVLKRDHYAGDSSPAPAAVMRRSAPGRPHQGRAQAETAGQEERLAELRDALRRSEEAADADYRFQSAKLKLEELGKKLQKLDEIDQRAAGMDADIEALTGCDTLPADLNQRLDEHEQRQGQKMAKVDDLTRDIEELNLQIDGIPRSNLLTDKLFILGVFIAVLSVVAGLFVLTTEQAHYFPLGVLVALVLIAFAWYRGSLKSSERKALTKEVEALQAELAELEKSFEQGGAHIDACMKATGSNTIAELRDKVDNYRYFLSLKSEIDEERGRTLGGLAPEDLHAEYIRQQQEMNELEQAAAAVARYAVDTYSLRQDIERIEAELSAAAPFDFGAGQPEYAGEIGFAAPFPAAARNGFTTELAVASRIGGIEIETLVPAVAAAAQRNLALVTAGKYIRIEVGHDGDPVVHGHDDAVVNFSELSHGTRELLYFCLRTGLVEALAGKRRLPLILDDPLGGFDPGRQQAACQILRTLGSKTQVILFTSNPALRTAADAAAELK
jgi:hypothetical protein